MLRSRGYSSACTCWSGILLIQSLVVLTVTNAIFAMFLRRMGGLCLSTFIPFGPTPEELKQEALLLAGIATVLVGVAMAFPLWHLLRTDCLPWHNVAAVVIGMALGMIMKPVAVPMLMMLTQGVLIVGGLGLAATCLWLMFSLDNAQMSAIILVPLTVVLVCIGGFALCDARHLFEIDIAGLPPAISGRFPHAGVFLFCLYAATLSLPGFCYFALSHEASDSVKQFLDSHLILSVGAGIAMIACLYWLFQPRPDEFMSVPLAMLSVAAVNAVVSMVPPVLWMTHPVNIGLR